MSKRPESEQPATPTAIKARMATREPETGRDGPEVRGMWLLTHTQQNIVF
jgi:hypothetical protein